MSKKKYGIEDQLREKASDYLYRYFDKNNITKKEVASVLNTTPEMVRRYLDPNEKDTFSLEQIIVLADTYYLSLDEIFDRKNATIVNTPASFLENLFNADRIVPFEKITLRELKDKIDSFKEYPTDYLMTSELKSILKKGYYLDDCLLYVHGFYIQSILKAWQGIDHLPNGTKEELLTLWQDKTISEVEHLSINDFSEAEIELPF